MRKLQFPVYAAATVLAVTLALAAAAHAGTAWFAPYTPTAVGNGEGPGPAPRGTVAADFNGDGKPDVVTINNFGNGNLIFIPGNGNGTFGTPVLVPNTSGLQIQGIDAGDVNRDGNQDVIAASTSTVYILLGDGHGNFTAGASYPQTLGGQVEPRLVDVNGDGALDIVAPTFTAIQTLINNGAGTFTAGPTSTISGASALSAISPANLNRDGRADLLAVDGSSGNAYELLGNGAGAFTVTGTAYASGFVPEDVAAIDLNGDGCDDLAMITSFSFTVDTALSNCAGGFTSPLFNSYQYSGSGPTSLTAADFNHDGRTDLAISSLANSSGDVKILAGNGTAAMTVIGDNTVPSLPQNPVVADFTGDGKPDILTAEPGSIALLRNLT